MVARLKAESRAPADIRIREATPGDAESIASVLAAAFRELEPLYTPGGFRATVLSADAVRRRLAEGPTWLAEYGDSVVGTVSAVRRGDALYVRGMAVSPSDRGRGVASCLLATIEAYALAHQLRRLDLSTTPFLGAAIRLYQRAGFRFSHEGPRDLAGTPLLTMTKELEMSSRNRER
jgi:putative acetyltransferase